ncbi:hypothetical protein D915_004233 [Fasciola hepatica]|uniref:Uncharacterized protein n=1 Tax=Fasciola hepatica TaxID=6192 RepID=A0A4E0RER2_FASHE|nr:hypothetical protein D915_004233 [Fasciola hepatica]
MNKPEDTQDKKHLAKNPVLSFGPHATSPSERQSRRNILSISLKTSVKAYEQDNTEQILGSQAADFTLPLKDVTKQPDQAESKTGQATLPDTTVEAVKNGTQPIDPTMQETKHCEHVSDNFSLQSDNQTSQISHTTNKTSKVIITPIEPKFRTGPDEILSLSSMATPSSVSADRPSILKRSSVGWNRRVSINTPQHRVSEHEVNWIEPDEESESSSSDDISNEFDVTGRPSIVVNMNSIHGKRISISLEKLEKDMKEYLAQEDEDNELSTHN